MKFILIKNNELTEFIVFYGIFATQMRRKCVASLRFDVFGAVDSSDVPLDFAQVTPEKIKQYADAYGGG